jgi:hypothetical protein
MTRPLYDDDDEPRFHPEHIDDNINANPGGKKFVQKEVPPMTRLSDERAQALIDGTAAMHPAEVASLASEVLESREAMKGAAVVANHSGSLLREKDVRIAELEAEVKRLRESLDYYAGRAAFRREG